MSNPKSDQTVTGNPQQAIKVTSPQSNQQEKSFRGAKGHLQSKDHFYPKTKFQEQVNYRKNT